jgi:DNA-binding NtrC family response regulator
MTGIKILIIDDDKLTSWALSRDFQREGNEVILAADGKSGLKYVKAEKPQLVLLDLRLPDISGLDLLKEIKAEHPDAIVILMTAYGTVQTAVEAVKLGAENFIKKPFDYEEIKALIEKALKNNQLSREVTELREQLREKFGIRNLVGQSYAMKRIFELIQKISKSNATTVLITGESGTGKDLVAKAIHYESNRAQYPFMAINCGTLPDPLLESELFGHEKGAFTDAKEAKKGLFELANHGTVLLDEIGDASLNLQVKLLRFLEEKKFKRIGGTRDIEVDIRVIAATNRNLKALVREGKFREDLFYRLNVIPITIPPLRERPEDIELLVKYYINHFNREFNKQVKGITDEAMKILLNYHWPGNVRELKNVIERIMILESGDMITEDHIPHEIRNPADFAGGYQDLPFPAGGLSLEEVERTLIKKALHYANWNKAKAARLLGISRHALRYKIQKYELQN